MRALIIDSFICSIITMFRYLSNKHVLPAQIILPGISHQVNITCI